MSGASPAPWIIDVEEQDFERLVVQESERRPVVIDFWAPWCGPCRQLGPLLEKIADEYRGQILLAKMDVDQCQTLAAHFGIEAIPAVRVVKEGRLVEGFNGVRSEAELREFFSRFGPTPVDPQLLKAHALEEGRPAEAEAIYRKHLEKDPTGEDARLGLARVLIAQKKNDEVEAVLEPLPTDGPVGAEVQRLRSLLSLSGLSADVSGDESTLRQRLAAEPENAQFRYELGCALAQKGKHEEALEMLLSAAERDMKLASGKVREAMVQIFYAVGPTHPLSNHYRAALARLLY